MVLAEPCKFGMFLGRQVSSRGGDVRVGVRRKDSRVTLTGDSVVVLQAHINI